MLTAQARDRQNFDNGWRFVLADSAQMSKTDYHDTHWRALNLPHDWAVEGDFLCSNPSGAGGGALPGGIGWYRKTFNLQKKQGERYFIEFDGVYMNARVYINGKEVGYRPYGYSSFEYDITPYLIAGRNVVAVRVDNSDQPNSRWYSGCGIYRHVWFTKTADVHVKHWGVHVVANPDGRVSVTADVESQGKAYKVRNQVFDAQGRAVGLKVRRPHLWSVDDPYIYKVRTQVLVGGKVVDEVWTNTGFRSFRFDAKTGFWLNGKNMKLNGVCEHHDFGCLGAVVNEDAMHRKLVRLKEMGVNAIRSSHNPPAPELLNMCDTMGLIVMDESFDMWHRRKTQNDYARFFDEWHERDLSDLILRDRNHPSILMWSIGNEVLEQWDETSTQTEDAQQANIDVAMGRGAKNSASDQLSPGSLLTRQLVEIVRKADPTRPVTAGCNAAEPSNNLFKANALDLIGFNYHNDNFDSVPYLFKNKPFYVSESNSALMTRGYYKMPSTKTFIMPKDWMFSSDDPSVSCSSYDNCHVPWGSSHERTMIQVRDNNFISGQFVWTGFDYIGEPTPYKWPARSSYFGIVDLAGIPKDAYYLYQAEWQSEKTVLHVFPHWNWKPGEEVDLWCYYNNADEVELFINGKSKGVQSKNKNMLHAFWRVNFEAGECRVVSRKDGKQVAERIINTADRPAAIRLTPDRQKIHADGDDLCFVTVEVVDKDGNLCPNAQNLINFKVEGVAQIEGVDNGCPFSLERFKDDKRKAFYGKCMVVLRSNGKPGNARIVASSEGLKTSELTFNCLTDETY